MINIKRIGSLALAALLLTSTACTLSVPSDKGGENQNAQIVNAPSDPDTAPETDPEEPDAPQEEQFVLAEMDSKYHSYCDGKVYYREYKKSDYAEDIMLYYGDPFTGGIYNSTTPKKLCALNADGSVETITEEDPGQGVMYVIDNVLYSQYFMEDGAEADINPTHVYKYDLKTKERKDIPGYCQVEGRIGDDLILLSNSLYDVTGYVAGVYCIVDPKDYTISASFDSGTTFICSDYNSMYGIKVDSDYSNGDPEFSATIYRAKSDGSVDTLATLDASNFSEWYMGYPEVTCYQIVGSHLFVNLGYYAGTGHFYQEGMILDIDTINKTYKKIADVDVETFYITEGMDGMFANYYQYNENDGISKPVCTPIDGSGELKAEDYAGQQYMKPYYHYADTDNFKSGEVSIYTDVAGKPTKLISKSDYDGFGYTLGIEEGVDYDIADQTELYNVEYAGNKLFFSIAIMERNSEYDVGWRYCYKVKKFANFVKDLKTGEVTKLYEE